MDIYIYTYPQAAWFAVSVNVYVAAFWVVFFLGGEGSGGGLITFTRLRFKVDMLRYKFLFRVEMPHYKQGGNTTLQI